MPLSQHWESQADKIASPPPQHPNGWSYQQRHTLRNNCERVLPQLGRRRALDTVHTKCSVGDAWQMYRTHGCCARAALTRAASLAVGSSSEEGVGSKVEERRAM